VRSAAPSNPSQAEEPRSQKRDVGHPLKSGRLQFDFRQRNHGPFGPPKVMKNGSCSAATVPGGTTPPFVISTGAHPDFLLRAAGDDHVCSSP
jgi:hypothetical protein